MIGTASVNTCNLPQCESECLRLGCYIGRRWVPGFGRKQAATVAPLSKPRRIAPKINQPTQGVLAL